MRLLYRKVKHATFGEGVIVNIANGRVEVDFNGIVKTFMLSMLERFLTVEEGYASDEERMSIEKRKRETANEEAKSRSKEYELVDKLIKNIENCGATVAEGRDSISIRLDSAQMKANSISPDVKLLIKTVFQECDKASAELLCDFNPQMAYARLSSRARSVYRVGFLCNYKDVYVIRVFSRNDIYKNGVRKGVTVLHSDTTEIMRVLSVKGKIYTFYKNISNAGGNVTNSKEKGFWSQVGPVVFLNEVVRKCDCKYLNEYIAEENIDCKLYAKLLFAALVDNNAEIVFKHKLFSSVANIKDIKEYLKEFTPKQTQFASENDVINALPIIKKHGIYDLEILKEMERVMERRWRFSIYDKLKAVVKEMHLTEEKMDKMLMDFIKKVDHWDPVLYSNYIDALPNHQEEVSMGDLFDEDYVQKYKGMIKEERIYTWADESDYCDAAKSLAWIDREENGYFIIVPKTIEDFRQEGIAQHHCVFWCRYFLSVTRHDSIIVFLRKEKQTSYVTIEYDYASFKVKQAFGKNNKKIPAELYQYVEELGKRLYKERILFG